MKIQHTPHPWEFDPENVRREFHVGLGIMAPTAKGSVAHIPLSRLGALTPAIENTEAEGDAQLVALAPTAPHDCNIEGCPGRENQRKLEAAEKMHQVCLEVHRVEAVAEGREMEIAVSKALHELSKIARAALQAWERKP